MGAAVPAELVANSAKLREEEMPAPPASGAADAGFEQAEAPKCLDASVEQGSEGKQGDPARSKPEEAPAVLLGGPSPSEASAVWPEQVAGGEAAAAAAVAKTFKTYYLVKIPRRPQDRSQLEAVNSELEDRKGKRNVIAEALKKNMAARKEVSDELKEANNSKLYPAREQLKALLAELDAVEEEIAKIDAEHDHQRKINEVEYALQHETLTLQKEKMLIRDLKTLKDYFKTMSNSKEVPPVRREELVERLQELRKKRSALFDARNAAQNAVDSLKTALSRLQQEETKLRNEMAGASEAQNAVLYEKHDIIKQQDAKNEDFYHYRQGVVRARKLAEKGDKSALEELCTRQGEEVLHLWNNDPAYRAEYVKNNEQSTFRRFKTLDARQLGIDEKPVSLNNQPMVVVNNKPEVAKVAATLEVNELAPEVNQTEEAPPVKPKRPEADTKAKTKAENKPVIEYIEEIYLPKEEITPEEAQARELAEIERRKAEEIEKAREAEARKKKLAEKKQAKAQLRQEREAQKKEKEKEKKLRKKALKASAGEGTSDENREENNKEAVSADDASEEAVAVVNEEGEEAEVLTERRLTNSNNARAVKSRSRQPPKRPSMKGLRKKRSLQQQLLDQVLGNWHILAVALFALVAASVLVSVFVSV